MKHMNHQVTTFVWCRSTIYMFQAQSILLNVQLRPEQANQVQKQVQTNPIAEQSRSRALYSQA